MNNQLQELGSQPTRILSIAESRVCKKLEQVEKDNLIQRSHEKYQQSPFQVSAESIGKRLT